MSAFWIGKKTLSSFFWTHRTTGLINSGFIELSLVFHKIGTKTWLQNISHSTHHHSDSCVCIHSILLERRAVLCTRRPWCAFPNIAPTAIRYHGFLHIFSTADNKTTHVNNGNTHTYIKRVINLLISSLFKYLKGVKILDKTIECRQLDSMVLLCVEHE